MRDDEVSSRTAAADAANGGGPITRPNPHRRFGTRRLLIATIGAATVNYATGCDRVLGTSVANLMAPPNLAPFGPVQGAAGVGNPAPNSTPDAQVAAGANAASRGDAAANDDDAGPRPRRKHGDDQDAGTEP